MAKNQYIAWILFLLLAVTIFNLFYKPLMKTTLLGPETIHVQQLVHPIQSSLCPLHGFKCPTKEPCDCSRMCTNGELYVPYRVLTDDHIYVLDRKLPPGTYCLPKGVGMCNQKTSHEIFSFMGWSCITRNKTIFHKDKLFACYHQDSTDNRLNILWDYRENRQANTDDILDYYEMYEGELRYRCKCQGKDSRGKELVNSIPFVCSPDYCIQDIVNPLPMMGWNGFRCECGPYFHKDPLDTLSPCVMEQTRVEKNQLIVRVECMNDNSFVKRPLYCPKEEGVLNFKIPFTLGNKPEDYLNVHRETIVN
ncbi:uncharacterized protein CDAR_422841 [Caerostris darwini]|uniref:Uncharacterized protein n=1 Tax=Caerostris darwini TaxID=1538125 RepID=A0AAV4W4X4_9ARAC|nr:uncharacterized protein CDAR_422841 [Caerostris darwini]